MRSRPVGRQRSLKSRRAGSIPASAALQLYYLDTFGVGAAMMAVQRLIAQWIERDGADRKTLWSLHRQADVLYGRWAEVSHGR